MDDIHTKFRKNGSSSSEVEMGGERNKNRMVMSYAYREWHVVLIGGEWWHM
jgi:hypothetical protein